MNIYLHGTDVLGGLTPFRDPRPFGFQGFNPYLETSPIYDDPPDDEWFVRKAGGGYQKVILGHGGHHGGGMVPGGWWWGGSYRGRGPWMDVDDFVDPMESVDPSIFGMHGTDVLGAEIIGMFDISQAQRQMNGLPKKITLRMALALLKGGQQAIDGAQAIAAKKNLPGGTARKNVADHLAWHAAAIATMTSAGASPNAFYDPGADLEKYVMMAFIESNASETGAAYLDFAWSQMWKEMGDAIAALPKEIRDVVVSSAGGLIETVTGLPVWAWALILVGGTALVGFLAYKIIIAAANTKAGAAAASMATRRLT